MSLSMSAASFLYGPAAKKLLSYIGDLIKQGELTVTFPDGTAKLFGRPGTLPNAEVNFRNWAGFRKVATGGELGFAEAYMSQDVDIPNLYSLFELILKNRGGNYDRDNPVDGTSLRSFVSWIKHKLKPNSKRGSRKNISAHYDLGNDFYRLWLDESMTYSSALYDGDEKLPLRTAQDQKYVSIMDRGGFTSNSHILEIGCGWGGFAEYAAKQRGCKVTGVTISQEQFNFASERMQREGLNELVELRLQDYRDVESSAFDGVASIEMFEAVGEKYWPTYFEKVRDVLKPNAKASLQIITIDDADFEAYRDAADFIQAYIFPGGMLPSVEVLNKVTKEAGLGWVDDIGFARDYALTLIRWRDKFESVWTKIEPMGFDERFRRMWNYYLDYCAAGFDHGTIDVRQITLQRQA